MTIALVICGAGANPHSSTEFAHGLSRLQRQTGPLADWHWAPHSDAASLLSTALAAGQGRPDNDKVLLLAHAQLLMADGTLAQLHAGLHHGLDMALSFGPQHWPAPHSPDYCTLRGLERYTQLMARLPPEPAQTLSTLPHNSLACLTSLGALRTLHAQGSIRAQWQPGCFTHDFSTYHQGHQGRSEMVPWVPAQAKRVLDVGGGEGYFLHALRLQRGCETHLAEFSVSACDAARPYVDHVWPGDFLTQDFLGWPHQGQPSFDCITFLDVLEHAPDPQTWLQRAKTLLAPDGTIVASIPNVGHWGVIADLLEGRWDYCPVGIHCVTHLRFFTEQGVQELFAQSGYAIEQCEAVLVPCPAQWQQHWAQTPGLQVNTASWNTYAFLIRARPVAPSTTP
ncbi:MULTISPECIES: class I SAM-dependent methyltransferase [Giesbergeria]|uniref:Class I SAM-dependent methyltransferase n=1 Tax=Giesbergeria sinuosa TaxID=80883 RepID=A0ABV9QB74_9BURK